MNGAGPACPARENALRFVRDVGQPFQADWIYCQAGKPDLRMAGAGPCQAEPDRPISAEKPDLL